MHTDTVYRTKAQVGPGNRILITVPELSEGDEMEVILLPLHKEKTQTAFEMVENLNLPIRDEAYWTERERELKETRNSWEV